MASSNRHWPSMFKSKPCSPHHQWQHDDNTSSLMSTGCHRSPFSSVPGCEERTPEPKPRWNPKPEQIRILEAIFNSGMVNPPREEIRKIRAQLQEYGQVGDANVFYWFQNRKSRSKNKLRHLQNTSKQQQQQNASSQVQTLQNPPVVITTSISTLAAPSSSSSSSEKSSPKLGTKRSNSTLSLSSPRRFLEHSNSPTGSVNQNMYFQAQNDQFLTETFFCQPVHQAGYGFSDGQQGLCFSDISNIVQAEDNNVAPCTNLLLSEIMNTGASNKTVDHRLEEKNLITKMHPQLGYTTTPPITHTTGLAPPVSTATPTTTETVGSVAVPSTINAVQGDQAGPVGWGTSAAVRSTVFINDVPFEVAVGPFNVREAFGEDVLLVYSSGQPVLTNELGITLQSLQHGGFYYLV